MPLEQDRDVTDPPDMLFHKVGRNDAKSGHGAAERRCPTTNEKIAMNKAGRACHEDTGRSEPEMYPAGVSVAVPATVTCARKAVLVCTRGFAITINLHACVHAYVYTLRRIELSEKPHIMGI